MAYNHADNAEHLRYWNDRKRKLLDGPERDLCDQYIQFYQNEEKFLNDVIDPIKAKSEADFNTRMMRIKMRAPRLTFGQIIFSPLYVGEMFMRSLMAILLWLFIVVIGAGAVCAVLGLHP